MLKCFYTDREDIGERESETETKRNKKRLMGARGRWKERLRRHRGGIIAKSKKSLHREKKRKGDRDKTENLF